MKNKTKMILKSIITFVIMLLLWFVMLSNEFTTLNWYEIAIITGFELDVIYKYWSCVNYWVIYICGKENITITDYDYEIKTKYNRNAKYYSVKPVIEYKGRKFKGCSFWEFSFERLKDTKPVLNCRVLNNNLIVL